MGSGHVDQLFRKTLSGIPSVSNSLDPDQAPHFVGPDLGPNCFQQTLVGKELRELQYSPINSAA